MHLTFPPPHSAEREVTAAIADAEDTLASIKLRKKQSDSARSGMAEHVVTEIDEAAAASEGQPLLGRPEGLKAIATSNASGRRLASLDVFRGLTIAVMILVDDAGGVYPAINHAPWDGITLADYVMPFFLFIIGVAMAIVFKRVTSPQAAAWKVVVRAVKLCALGVDLQGGFYRSRPGSVAISMDLTRLRFTGILQRIAFAYIIVGACEISVPAPTSVRRGAAFLYQHYALHWIVSGVLAVIYLALMYGLYVPDWQFEASETGELRTVVCGTRGSLTPPCSAVGYVDRLVLGVKHLYRFPAYKRSKECSMDSPGSGPLPPGAPVWCQAPFDPEGVLSSVSAVLSCFIGMHFGHVLVHYQGHAERIHHWLLLAVPLTLAGGLLHVAGFSFNKMIYSISYALFTGGAAGLVFTAFYYVVDVLRIRTPFRLLEWMGLNALLVFVLGACGILETGLRTLYWVRPEQNLIDIAQRHVFQHFIGDPAFAFLMYVITKIVFWCLVAGVLHRQRWYWKF
ncbi:heparan-alpha-glucosaminide N-acetyltransferase [Klebsormidium nitens]|uniref:Heparan-alpha-glucosaminide N-acetyltransferase n=1 Tax=Klebsormidium nitens TaxID=105231 RepID=A0A1Y1HW34_KLENI|nr:heparan-alpha-glucosaminide N-acetyltransferase [Klebsormidium nitens]|eukprot:GAQ81409.1 heparan-alpha-glucosaminide N-acetyltransferase [Klebsormidium nitens]